MVMLSVVTRSSSAMDVISRFISDATVWSTSLTMNGYVNCAHIQGMNNDIDVAMKVMMMIVSINKLALFATLQLKVS